MSLEEERREKKFRVAKFPVVQSAYQWLFCLYILYYTGSPRLYISLMKVAVISPQVVALQCRAVSA